VVPFRFTIVRHRIQLDGNGFYRMIKVSDEHSGN
jgi:hypothetical protein